MKKALLTLTLLAGSLCASYGNLIIGYDLSNFGSSNTFSTGTDNTYVIPFQFAGSGTVTLESVEVLATSLGPVPASAASVRITDTLPTDLTINSPMTFSTTDGISNSTTIFNYTADAIYVIDQGVTYYLALSGIDSGGTDGLAWQGSTLRPGNSTTTSTLTPFSGTLSNSDGIDYRRISDNSFGSGPAVFVTDYTGSGIGGFSITATAVPEASFYVFWMAAAALFAGLGRRKRRAS